MKRIAAVVAFYLTPAVALACAPCPKQLDITQTYDKAELVVQVRATSHEGRSMGDDSAYDLLLATPQKVFKGAATSTTLRIQHMHGMCPLGPDVAIGEEALLFLVKFDQYDGQTDAASDIRYIGVEGGCGVKSLPIQNGKVLFEEQLYEPSEFITLLQKMPVKHDE